VETQFPPVFERYYRSVEHRTCRACGHIHPAPERFQR
jgi:3-hydroxyanthranilate 3,4-dioxygenase